MWVIWNLVLICLDIVLVLVQDRSIRLEIVLVLVQDRCTVCARRTTCSVII